MENTHPDSKIRKRVNGEKNAAYFAEPFENTAENESKLLFRVSLNVLSSLRTTVGSVHMRARVHAHTCIF